MKYIIDIPKEYESDWVNKSSRLGFELCFPINETATNKKYYIPTGFKLEPYIEPDRKAIEDEVWEFARGLLNYTDDDWEVITNMLLLDIPYQEAKSKYEAWMESENEIHVGDEVEYGFIKGIAFDVDEVIVEGFYINDEGNVGKHFRWNKRDCEKTGRHFDEVDQMLEKMRGEEE